MRTSIILQIKRKHPSCLKSNNEATKIYENTVTLGLKMVFNVVTIVERLWIDLPMIENIQKR